MRFVSTFRSIRLRAGVVLVMLATTVAAAIYPSPVAASGVTTFDTFAIAEPVIVLTFDVTFDRGDGEMILDTLRDKNVVATFGITGIWAERNPDLIQRIVNEGHHMMNHTWNHPSLTGAYTGSSLHTPTLPVAFDQIGTELRQTEELIRRQVGVELRPYVRPPYGDHDAATLAAFAANGYTYNIMWTVDTLGWHGHSVEAIRQRVLDAARPGANILMHVGHGASDGLALPYIIDDLRARGYRFATVAQVVEGMVNDTVSPPGQRFFAQTGQYLGGNFLRYWDQYGGAAVFGSPITPEIEENGLTVQYFERARFELHPHSWPERFDVQLGRIGSDLTWLRFREAPFRPASVSSSPDCTFFTETGHNLCHGFRDYWEQHDGLATFGFPISEEYQEVDPVTGEKYAVQYFERQRLEWRPGRGLGRGNVVLGALGTQAYERASTFVYVTGEQTGSACQPLSCDLATMW